MNKIIGVFVCFSRMLLPGILIFKGLTDRRLYKSIGVKGLTCNWHDRKHVSAYVIDTRITSLPWPTTCNMNTFIQYVTSISLPDVWLHTVVQMDHLLLITLNVLTFCC
jgi:hypothetical protein